MSVSLQCSFPKKLCITSFILFYVAFNLFWDSALTASSEGYVFFSPSMASSCLSSYTEQEQEEIKKDLLIVRNICLNPCVCADQKQFYLATAGGPGSRKSTILERFLRAHAEFAHGSYLDPDQRALRFMVHTYYKTSLNALAVAEQEEYIDVRKQAYEKWRGASNYITNTLLEECFKDRKSIIHGTTATGEHVEGFFKKLKGLGYDITLLLCSCEDELRAQAVSYRNQEQRFYQATPEDAVSKGKAFPTRMPTYFALADTLYLFWSDNLFHKERLGAILKDGKISVVDQDALSLFISKYQKDRETLLSKGKEIPSWQELLSTYTNSHSTKH